MRLQTEEPGTASLRDVAWLSLAVAGLAFCITLMFLGMRAVMDIGGACADGGPYVSANPCPGGVALAMILGMFGLFLFGGIGIVAGIRVGASGALVPLLGWSALFATLGYNFIDYGLFNPPPGEGVVWGWLVPGVLFEIMGIGPLAFVVWAVRGSRGSDPSLALEKLQAARMAAATARRASEVDAEPKPRATTDALDRLERLAGLRERGLLGADEFEEAKAAVMRDLASGPGSGSGT